MVVTLTHSGSGISRLAGYFHELPIGVSVSSYMATLYQMSSLPPSKNSNKHFSMLFRIKESTLRVWSKVVFDPLLILIDRPENVKVDSVTVVIARLSFETVLIGAFHIL